jgi:polyhydroxyalkanoate synthase
VRGLLSLVLFVVGLTGCAKHLPPSMHPAESVIYETPDGWRNEIRHYPGTRGPVLLVHGLGANHYNFDFRAEVSLAHHLQRAGYDVWIPELRGDPGAQAPSRDAAWNFDFDDIARGDVPRMVDTVRERTGAPSVLWVGHSMGGMLLYTVLSTTPEKVGAGVVVGSPAVLDTHSVLHRAAKHAGFLLHGRRPMPAERLAQLASPLGRFNPMFPMLANPRQLDGPTAVGLARVALTDLTRPMAREAIRWIQEGKITDDRGGSWVRPAAVPILALGGSVDRIVPPANVAAACAIHPRCAFQELGAKTGFTGDYGHIDTLLGKNAAAEVYPIIETFLDGYAQPLP